jgi:tetratricopeptide (TPR) repeat protein
LEWAEIGWQGVQRHPKLDRTHIYFHEALAVYWGVLLERGEYAKAEPLLRLHAANYRKNDTGALKVRLNFGACLRHLGKFEESEEMLSEAFHCDIPANNTWWKERTATQLILLYDAWEKPKQAAKWREILETRSAH